MQNIQNGRMLNEISRVSAIKATAALSRLLKVPVDIDIMPVDVKRIKDIDKVMKPEDIAVSLFLPIKGNLEGISILIYPEASALSICDNLFKRRDGETTNITRDEISALTEVANIVIGNFLTPFAQPLQLNYLMHSAATYKHDTFESIMESLPGFTKNIDEGIVIEISFRFHHTKIKGYVIIMFDEKKISSILNQLPNIPHEYH